MATVGVKELIYASVVHFEIGTM